MMNDKMNEICDKIKNLMTDNKICDEDLFVY